MIALLTTERERLSSPTVRLLYLFLRQRSVPGSFLALLASIAGLIWLTDWIEFGDGQMRMAIVMMAGPAAIASIIGIAMWSPSTDLEQAASYPLRWPRLLHLLLVCGIGLIGTSVVAAGWAQQLVAIDQLDVWMRNTFAMIGLALLLVRIVNPRLSWLAPAAMAAAATLSMQRSLDDPETTINEMFDLPKWIVVGQSDTSTQALGISCVLIISGVCLVALRGPRVTDVAES